MDKERKEMIIIEFIRDFGHLPFFMASVIISVVVPTAIFSFYYGHLIGMTKESIALMGASSAFSLFLFLFLLLFAEWYMTARMLEDKYPRKGIIEKYLEDKK